MFRALWLFRTVRIEFTDDVTFGRITRGYQGQKRREGWMGCCSMGRGLWGLDGWGGGWNNRTELIIRGPSLALLLSARWSKTPTCPLGSNTEIAIAKRKPKFSYVLSLRYKDAIVLIMSSCQSSGWNITELQNRCDFRHCPEGSNFFMFQKEELNPRDVQ